MDSVENQRHSPTQSIATARYANDGKMTYYQLIATKMLHGIDGYL